MFTEKQHQNLRIGMGDKSILAALALATVPTDSNTTADTEDTASTSSATAPGTKEWIECVTRAYAQLPDFAALADRLHANRSETRLAEKLKWLPEHVPPTAGVPVLAMSAYPVGSVSEVLRRANKSGSSAAAFEYKYDGARVQLHFVSKVVDAAALTREAGNDARVFSRNMEDTTEKYGSLLDVLARQVNGDGPVSFIMEGEVVALDRATSTFHPFQVLQAKATTEFCLFAFDLLAINGENLLDVRASSPRRLCMISIAGLSPPTLMPLLFRLSCTRNLCASAVRGCAICSLKSPDTSSWSSSLTLISTHPMRTAAASLLLLRWQCATSSSSP